MTAHKFLTVGGLMLTLRLAALGTVSGDIATTQTVLAQGGRELNGMLSGPTVAKTVVIDAGMLGGIYTLEKGHPTLAKVLYVAVIASRGFAVVHNSQQVRR